MDNIPEDYTEIRILKPAAGLKGLEKPAYVVEKADRRQMKLEFGSLTGNGR